MKAVSLKLDETLDRKLTAAARKRGTSKSALVRLALEEYFEAKRQGSCLDLAHDLVGSAAGPDDLSENETYFEGFGQ